MRYLLPYTAVFLMILSGITGCRQQEPMTIGESGIESFQYSFGSYDSGYKRYYLKRAEDLCFFIENSYGGEETEINTLVSAAVLDDIRTIIEEEGMAEWNGFQGSDSDVLDGYGFRLMVTFEDETELHAEGYHKLPKNYETASNRLEEYLQDLAASESQKVEETQEMEETQKTGKILEVEEERETGETPETEEGQNPEETSEAEENQDSEETQETESGLN